MKKLFLTENIFGEVNVLSEIHFLPQAVYAEKRKSKHKTKTGAMKKNQLHIAALLLFLAVIISFTACTKRDNISPVLAEDNSPARADNKALEAKVEAWLKTQKEISSEKDSKEKIQILANHLILHQLWIEEYQNGEKFIAIPMNKAFISANNKDKNPGNYLLLILDSTGKIGKGNIVQYLPEKNITDNLSGKNLFYKLYTNKEMPDNATFTFLSITDHLQYEKTYKYGKQFSYSIIKIKPNNKNTSAVEGPAATNQITCTAWYWVTYYTDGTETWDYLYTTCVGDECQTNIITPKGNFATTNCAGGGGGGSNENDEFENAFAAFKSDYEINSASEDLSTEMLSETTESRTKKYSWVCGKAALIKARSLEYGTHKKVNNAWQWESLVHQSVSITGAIIGGSVSVSSHSGQATVGIYNAIMDVNYTLSYNAVIPHFSPVNWSVTKSAASNWHVNY